MMGFPQADRMLFVLAGGIIGGGIWLLIQALTPKLPEPANPQRNSAPLKTVLLRLGRRGLIALFAGVATLLITHWIVGGLAAGALVVAGPALFGGAKSERLAMERLEALAAWTESLRDTIAGAVGLEQAIPATAHAAGPTISAALYELSDRMRVRTPMPVALAKFADDLNDTSADLIVAALILNSRLRGPGLRQVLGSLAEAVREDLDMRRRISASRASTRRSVQIVVGITLSFIIGLVLLNRTYLIPYSSLLGQLVLGVVVFFFAAGFFWMRQLAKFETPERFLRPDLARSSSWS